MAEYNRSEALELAFYNMPALKPGEPAYEPVRKPEPRSLNAGENRKGRKLSVGQTLKIFAVAITLFGLFVSILFSRISLAMLEKEAGKIETDISEAKSENVRLQMAFNSSVSREKVEDFAVNVLGMQKVERYQIHYFENRDGDEVVIADGKTVEMPIEADIN